MKTPALSRVELHAGLDRRQAQHERLVQRLAPVAGQVARVARAYKELRRDVKFFEVQVEQALRDQHGSVQGGQRLADQARELARHCNRLADTFDPTTDIQQSAMPSGACHDMDVRG